MYCNVFDFQNVRIFAGVRKAKDGGVSPVGVGRLCHWTHQGDDDADDYPSFGAYQRTLELKCDQGEPGVIQWTPDANTPDTVYYQVKFRFRCHFSKKPINTHCCSSVSPIVTWVGRFTS